MPRWFWYLSPQKVGGLKCPSVGWKFLTDRVGNLELEAGVPWAKLSSKGRPDPSLLRDLEIVERDIRKKHSVTLAHQIQPGQTPIFFEFHGVAGHLVLRESYEGEDGDCVFVMVGLQEDTGVILLGSGSNVFGSRVAPPRYVNPSVDPVGALLVKLDAEARKGMRAGIARDAQFLSIEETVLYSFASALSETTAQLPVRSLAVFTAQVGVGERTSIEALGHEIPLPSVQNVILGSPVYVEQLESEGNQ